VFQREYNRRSIWMCWLSYGTLALCVYIMAFVPVWAQQDLQPRQLVEAPTAGLLLSCGLGLDLWFYGGDGILGGV